ncbi:MAG: nucleoside hydrolase [Planctomycetota bacterium]|jgi:purine nucleosidase|nr:nucleoside hydrolase [Planctomycetota bacterium]
MDLSLIGRGLTNPSGHPVRMVLDTDTYNEIDDQFALAYALLAQDAMCCEAVYAAPFHNERSDGPGDGMRKSLEEIERVCTALGMRPRDGIFSGSERWLASADDVVDSPAVDDLIERSKREGLLYVVAIGAPTNVAAALNKDPTLKERIVVVWLGGHPLRWHITDEFNCRQDKHASRVLFDSGVPHVMVPCANVAQALTTTRAEVHEALEGQGAIGDYLCQIYDDYVDTSIGRSKVIWDISAVAWLINANWFTTRITPSPILTDDDRWQRDERRHPIREVLALSRDAIYHDLFSRVRRLS